RGALRPRRRLRAGHREPRAEGRLRRGEPARRDHRNSNSGGSNMSESQTEPAPRAPVLPERAPVEVAPRVHVLTDDRIDLVPNIGIVVGDERVLVVDTAMGVTNGERVLARARELADRDLILTITHFHPEHGWGAQAFEGSARIVYNRLQVE